MVGWGFFLCLLPQCFGARRVFAQTGGAFGWPFGPVFFRPWVLGGPGGPLVLWRPVWAFGFVAARVGLGLLLFEFGLTWGFPGLAGFALAAGRGFPGAL